jgi:tetratricopeptide (TPR) repeat protein
VLGLALDRLAFALARSGQAERSLPLYERALRVSTRGGDPHEVAITRLHHGAALLWCGRPDEALAELDEAAASCDRYGFLYTRSLIHWATADVRDACGEPERALAARDAELALLEVVHNDWNLAGCQAHRATLLRRLGRRQEAEVAGRAALAAAGRLGDPTLTEQVTQALTGR